MVTRRELLATLVGMALAVDVQATAQIPDEFVFDGQAEMLVSHPLDAYLLQGANYNKLKPWLTADRCSGSWRGYRAVWQIRDGWLELVRLESGPCSQRPKQVPLEALFGPVRKPVVATWYTGVLVVPRGRLLRYVHMGYESEYERYAVFSIVGGKEIAREETADRPR